MQEIVLVIVGAPSAYLVLRIFAFEVGKASTRGGVGRESQLLGPVIVQGKGHSGTGAGAEAINAEEAL